MQAGYLDRMDHCNCRTIMPMAIAGKGNPAGTHCIHNAVKTRLHKQILHSLVRRRSLALSRLVDIHPRHTHIVGVAVTEVQLRSRTAPARVGVER